MSRLTHACESKMFGAKVEDPKFNYLGQAFGLKTNSYVVGTYPKIFAVTRGANVRIFLGNDSDGKPLHGFFHVEDFDCEAKTMSGYLASVPRTRS